MPNWCNTSYVIYGEEKDVKKLYDLMRSLENADAPIVENGFGKTFLGCLVKAIGGDFEKVSCRGEWYGLEMNHDDEFTFDTTTAWAPMNDVFDLVMDKYPSLNYLYMAEEPGIGIYETNDEFGSHFSDRYIVEMNTPKGEYFHEYFENIVSAFGFIEEESGRTIKTEEDVSDLNEEWKKESDENYCFLYEFEIV